jgi:hypothetical protein
MKQTNGRLVTRATLESLASKAGLRIQFLPVDHGGFNWFVFDGSVPLYQGGADSVFLWLQGYARAVEKIDSQKGEHT